MAQDKCTGTSSAPVMGQTCIGGAIYAGQYNGYHYMITPSGCTNLSCAGASGIDTVSMAWADAIHWCMNMNYGGYQDWLLPSQDELDFVFAHKAALGGGFASPYYWSSSEGDADTAWTQSSKISKGDVFTYLRCVRKY